MSGHISPRRASVPAYVASLLLRSLPAIDKDPSLDAGRPINFIDAVSDDVLPGEQGASDASLWPTFRPVTRTTAHSGASICPGSKPLPDTAQEFAAQVLNRKRN